MRTRRLRHLSRFSFRRPQCPRQFHDVGGGILKRDELSAVGESDRIVEGPFPVRFWPNGQRRIPSTA
jgi:hypothetical protein